MKEDLKLPQTEVHLLIHRCSSEADYGFVWEVILGIYSSKTRAEEEALWFEYYGNCSVCNSTQEVHIKSRILDQKPSLPEG